MDPESHDETPDISDLIRKVDQAYDVIGQFQGLIVVAQELLKRDTNKNHIEVTHKTEGMSAWGAAGVTACFCTMVMLLAALFIIMPELHDLKAWEQIHQNHINALEAKEKTK